MQAIFKSALEQNVAFVPGDSFYARPSDNRDHDSREGSRHMRLNFSNAAPEQIREGIRRLAAAVKSHLDDHADTIGAAPSSIRSCLETLPGACQNWVCPL